MAICTVKVSDEEITRAYFSEIDEKLRSPDAFQNPFKGRAKTFWRAHELLAVVQIEPIYPPIWMAGFLFLAVSTIWGEHWWFTIPMCFFFTLGWLWNDRFYILMIRKGLRRKGYSGKISRLSAKKALGWLVGTDRSI